MSVLLREMTWEQVQEVDNPSTVIILPVGSNEQHGPHLPLETDSRLCEEVAVQAAQRVAEHAKVLVAPILSYGASSHHLAFPGTMSLSTQLFTDVVAELCECLIKQGFRKILVLNGHGGNHDLIKTAARNVMDRTGISVAAASYWFLGSEELEKVGAVEEVGHIPGHASGFETSCMLAVRPNLVRKHRILEHKTDPPNPFFAKGFPREPKVVLVQHTPAGSTGLHGDPSIGSEEKGQRYVEAIVHSLVEFLTFYAAQ